VAPGGRRPALHARAGRLVSTSLTPDAQLQSHGTSR
jgi:hypothetical protein